MIEIVRKIKKWINRNIVTVLVVSIFLLLIITYIRFDYLEFSRQYDERLEISIELKEVIIERKAKLLYIDSLHREIRKKRKILLDSIESSLRKNLDQSKKYKLDSLKRDSVFDEKEYLRYLDSIYKTPEFQEYRRKRDSIIADREMRRWIKVV